MTTQPIDPEIAQKPTEAIDNDQGLVNWLENDCFKPALQARKPYEKPALTSLLFWAGNQWQEVEEDILSHWAQRKIDLGTEEVMRIVDNRVATSARAVVAGCTGSMPTFVASPATLDKDDVFAARLGTRALKWRERADKENVKRREEVQWLYGTGDCLRRTWFNPRGGRPGIAEGDLSTEVVNLFRYVTDPMSDPSDWPPKWLIEFDAMPVDEVKTLYPGAATKDLQPEDSADLMRYLDRLAMNVMFARVTAREQPKTMVVVKRAYFRPTDKYPNGRAVVFTGNANKPLDDHELQAGVFPFARGRWYPIPGRLYGMGTIELLLSDQKRLNIIKTALHEVIKCQIRGDMVQQGTGVVTQQTGPNGAKIISIPRDVVSWQFMKYDLNLEQAKFAAEELVGNIKEKGGTRDPSLGNTVQKDVTAYELAISKDADLGTQAWHMEMYAEDMQVSVCETKLALMKGFYKNQRMLTAIGKQSAQDSPYFYGADLRDTTDVQAIPTPHLSPADRTNIRRQAASDGLMGPYPNGPAQQVSARMQLRAMGLDEEEEDCATMYGPIEDVMVAAGEIQRLSDGLLAVKLKSELQAAQAPPAPPPTPGQPEMVPGAAPGAGVDEEAMQAVIAEEIANQTPVGAALASGGVPSG